jgi:enoyl-CoA hydratase
MDLELCVAISAAMNQAASDRVRAVVFTGTGAIFSAGVDLVRLTREGGAYASAFMPALSDAFLDVFRFPAPVVAAVNGHAIAGGAVLAWACDWRVLARGNSRFGVPELLVGVPFPLVPSEIVRHALPPPGAEEAMFLGATREPEDCLALGWVHELSEPGELVERAVSVARTLSAAPAESYRLTKLTARTTALERIERLRASHDAEVTAAWASDAVLGAVRAYVERTLRK